jgi:hypothetical protein
MKCTWLKHDITLWQSCYFMNHNFSSRGLLFELDKFLVAPQYTVNIYLRMP